jgi:Fe-Mn family superoxide dismutase
MRFEQAPLPYDKDALEPHISRATMEFHYDRHYAGYVRSLNRLTKDTDYENLDLENTIIRARAKGDTRILQNAAQAWNHEFFFNSLSPNGGKPDGTIGEVIKRSFNSLDEFKRNFRKAAVEQFGSGWIWLVVDRGKLKIVSGPNADTPVGTELVPLLALDVWEHAYYLDYQHDRQRFADLFLENLVNWNFVAANLERAMKRKAA